MVEGVLIRSAVLLAKLSLASAGSADLLIRKGGAAGAEGGNVGWEQARFILEVAKFGASLSKYASKGVSKAGGKPDRLKGASMLGRANCRSLIMASSKLFAPSRAEAEIC